MRDYTKFYIDGEWVTPLEPRTLDVINPATESAAGVISLGSRADVDWAVAAAQRAFETFSRTTREERIVLLERIIEVYKRRLDDMAQVISEEMGAPIATIAKPLQAGPQPTPGAPQGAANHQELLLRMYWDGRERPAVEAPLGDFFANAFGVRSEVISLPVIVEDADSYNCYWRMPFRKSARIEVVNESDKPLRGLYHNIDWIQLDSLPEDTPYFLAQHRQEYPVEKGKDYVILDTRGKGHYVGTVLAVRMRSPAWFREGDEKIYIDAEEKPSIWGTGTEGERQEGRETTTGRYMDVLIKEGGRWRFIAWAGGDDPKD